MRQGGEQVLGGQPAGRPGVDEAAEGVHEHRPHELARLGLHLVELVQGLGIQHDDHLRSGRPHRGAGRSTTALP